MDLNITIDNTEIKEGELGIFWLGQAGFILKDSNKHVIYLDPYLSNYLEDNPPHGGGWKRLVESPIKSSEVNADIIAITHNHEDHLDPISLPEIARTSLRTKFLGPTSCCWRLAQLGVSIDKIVEMKIGKDNVVNGVKVKSVPAHHPDLFSPQWDSIGYLFDLGGVRVYFTGDSLLEWEIFDMKHYKPVDIMFVGINGAGSNMNEEEAAVLAKEIDPKIVIPMHYGMFKEAGPGKPEIFLDNLRRFGVKSKPVLMSVGKSFVYTSK